MSTSPVGNSSIQDLAASIMRQFDTNKDGQFSVAEFSSFLDKLMTGMGGATTALNTTNTTALNKAGAGTDKSAWDTGGYQAPQHTAASFGPVMLGWDGGKWVDPNLQTPKYVVGRILSQYPHTIEGLGAAMAEIQMAYPGTQFDGKDKITIPGVGTIDVLLAAGGPGGGAAWQWLPVLDENGVPYPE